MKSFFRLFSLILPALYGSILLASEGRDCALFTGEDIQGEQRIISAASDREGTASTLTAPFNQNVSSVWLKNGYTLEVYNKPKYKGTLLTLHHNAAAPQLKPVENGVFANLKDFGFDKSVESYRCRATGETMEQLRLTYVYRNFAAYNNTRFEWVSGGNHPDHKYAEIKQKDGKRTLWVYDDNTYGNNATEYTMDLDTGAISIKYHRVPNSQGTLELAKPAHEDEFAAKLTYLGALHEMEKDLAAIAAGSDLGYSIIAPKPELNDVLVLVRSLKSIAVY